MAGSVGRYTDVRGLLTPGDLPPEGDTLNGHGEIEHGGVADPNPSLKGKRQRTALNIRTDALEFEYARGRISGAGYWAGRTYGRVLERSRPSATGAGAWSRGDRVDQVISHELKVLGAIVRAQDATQMIAETAPIIGLIAQRLLELALVDGLTLTEAARRMKGGAARQDVIFHAELFRRSCEQLADFWCGPRKRAPR